MTDADGNLTDPMVYAALAESPHRDRAMRLFADATSGPKDVELTLDWSFSPAVDWNALPPVVLDRICDFLLVEDVLCMMLTCAGWRAKLKKNVAIRAVTQVWLDACERRQRFRETAQRVQEEEEARNRAVQRGDRLCVAMPVVALVASIGSQLAVAVPGIAYFALLRQGLSVVPSCPEEPLIYSLLYAACALLMLNAVLLAVVQQHVWRRRGNFGVMFPVANTAGVLSNGGVTGTSTAVLALSAGCALNPLLAQLAHVFCSVTLALGVFQLAVGAYAVALGWRQSYLPLLQTIKCC